MAATREQVMAALYALGAAATGFVTTSRTLKHVESVNAIEMPAFYQAEGQQMAVTKYNQPINWTFNVDWFVYVHMQTGPGAFLASSLNTQIDNLIAALVGPVPGCPQTLGGLVGDARVNGTVEVYEGQLDEKAVAIIPIEIHANI